MRLATQADLLHNDVTTARVLELMPAKADRASSGHSTRPGERERTGVFTTDIVAITGSHRVALYFTGRQCVGKNLADVLAHRDAALGPPLHICDGLLSGWRRAAPHDRYPGVIRLDFDRMDHGRRRVVSALVHLPAWVAARSGRV